MNDELELIRAPVPVGVAAGEIADRPAIDARAVVTRPRRPASARAAPLRPPDPLGVLDTDTSRVLQPSEPARGRRRWLVAAVAAAIVAVVAVPALIVGLRGDDEPTSGGLVASPPSSAAVPIGTAEITAVMWGPEPNVCPDDEPACYMIDVRLSDHEPGRRLDVACEVADRPVLGGTTATVDGDGVATARVACAANRAARSIAVTVDGEVAATVDLPTTIVPTPTVTFTNDRSAVGEPGCSAAACRHVDVTLTGFEPGSTVTVSCVSDVVGSFSSSDVTIGSDGTASDDACYFGYPAQQFWVEADGVRSPAISWPED
jgi:hypothetical protein